jgi:hypothetical protein
LESHQRFSKKSSQELLSAICCPSTSSDLWLAISFLSSFITRTSSQFSCKRRRAQEGRPKKSKDSAAPRRTNLKRSKLMTRELRRKLQEFKSLLQTHNSQHLIQLKSRLLPQLPVGKSLLEKLLIWAQFQRKMKRLLDQSLVAKNKPLRKILRNKKLQDQPLLKSKKQLQRKSQKITLQPPCSKKNHKLNLPRVRLPHKTLHNLPLIKRRKRNRTRKLQRRRNKKNNQSLQKLNKK